MHRRYLPTALGLLAAATLAWYLVYTQLLLREMRRENAVHSRIIVTIFRGLGDPREDAAEDALLQLSEEVQRLRIPIVVTDMEGGVVGAPNLPFAADPADPADAERIRSYAVRLSRDNPPIVEPGLGVVFFGDPVTVRRLRWIPWLQVGAMLGLLGAAAAMVRHNQRTERERIWAAMARESAHQMGTPLSSLAGWVEILRLPDAERQGMASLPAVAAEMEADLDRLEKVSRRFEWIGRPIRLEPVEVRTLLGTLERYVRTRLPQLGRGVELRVEVAASLPPIAGNAVLLEWALENLLKNALDALAGAGGTILLQAEDGEGRQVALRVRDDGPGVAPAVRATLFDAGVSTKKSGWGVGLSLSRRIVQDVHKGSLSLEATERGASFLMLLPAADAS
ncbi:MAG: HAMP domain-containing histidine kinase [Gemmatimonadota bacterium]|nr:HAMP domain-containing histidine kinase [Gemmatimonadota bacterium]